MSDALRAFVCWAPNGACDFTKLYNQRLGKMVVREEGSWRFRPPPNTAKRTMLPNEEFALACRAYYEEQGLIVDATNGQFAHCPLPKEMGETGYYLLWEHHQQQGLLQSRDVGRCCFWVGHAKQWLNQCDYWPDNYFDLWNIYDEFTAVISEIGAEGLRLSREQGLHLTPEAKAKRVTTYKQRGHNPSHLQEKQIRQRAAQSMRDFWNSEEGMLKRVEIRNRPAPRNRVVEITFPDGRVGIYSRVKFAAIALGVSEATVGRWINGENAPQGKHKGLKAREVK